MFISFAVVGINAVYLYLKEEAAGGKIFRVKINLCGKFVKMSANLCKNVIDSEIYVGMGFIQFPGSSPGKTAMDGDEQYHRQGNSDTLFHINLLFYLRPVGIVVW